LQAQGCHHAGTTQPRAAQPRRPPSALWLLNASPCPPLRLATGCIVASAAYDRILLKRQIKILRGVDGAAVEVELLTIDRGGRRLGAAERRHRLYGHSRPIDALRWPLV